METLESIRMCRLCGKQLHNTMAIHIFGNPENYEKKIRSLLPILVHEMDCLPKYMCYNCSDKVREFYNFYIQTLKLDIEMKNKLSWMKNNTEERHNGVPTVYYADLKSLKIKSEMENFENYNSTQLNQDFDLVSPMNSNCSMKKSDEDFHEDKFDCFPTSTTSDNDEKHFKDEQNRLPLSVTIPLVRINNQLRSSRIVRVLDSKPDTADPIKITASADSSSKDVIRNNNHKNTDSDFINTNCLPLIMPEVLIKCETKENDEFVRKLRPRRNLNINKSSAKIIKKEQIEESSKLETDYKSRDLLTDLKLSRKVEIKVEKLDCETVTRSREINMNSKYNESKKMDYYCPESINNVPKKPKLETKNNVVEKMKPLRAQNNLRDMGRYKSKVEIHMKGITVKLTKINVADLKKQKTSRKSRNKISKTKKKKKVHETYSCERCHELFTKRELYRLHFCYLH